MKFKDYKYVRPDLDELKSKLKELTSFLTDNYSMEEQYDAYLKIDDLMESFSSAVTLVSIRFSLNTKDEFYKNEQDFYDVELPNLMQYFNQVSLLLAKSKHREALEEKLGKLMLNCYHSFHLIYLYMRLFYYVSIY